MTDRRGEMLAALVHSQGPLSGDDLAAQLGVSSRTIRSYVRALNRRAPLITATHRGYVIDRDVHREIPAADEGDAQTPEKRLQFLCRHLAQQSRPTGVQELVDLLCVSESTLDSDLARARDSLRRHDLVLRRDRGMVWAEGSEHSRRRAVLEMSEDPGGGLVTTTWRAFCAQYVHFDVKGLRDGVAALVGDSALELSEYAVNDLVMHLAVAVDRIGRGWILPAGTGRAVQDAAVAALCDRIAELVEDRYAVALAVQELAELDTLLAARVCRGADPAPAVGSYADLGAVVAELMDEVAFHYVLGRPDASLLHNLTVHVQNVVARARGGSPMLQPLGVELKNDHPLVHDLALCFAAGLEERLGIPVDAGELDYLAFHLGMQYMGSLDERDVITLALVVPRFYDHADRLAAKIGGLLRGQAVVMELVTSVGFDFTAATSDLIVSCLQPEGRTSAPVVVISPFLISRDIEALLTAVQRAREGRARRRVRSALAQLLDPSLFFRDDQVDSPEGAIGLLCEALRDAGHVDEDFGQLVLERELRSSTSYGGEFAMPHSMRMDARRTSMAVLVSEKGILWGSSRVRLVFLLATSPEGRGLFRDVLEDISGLLASRASVAGLVAGTRGFDEFVSALSELIEGNPSALRREQTLFAVR